MLRGRPWIGSLLATYTYTQHVRGLKQKARLSVILKENVVELGQAGTTLKVRHGFARNFLVPQKVAVVATPAAASRFAKAHKELEDASTAYNAKQEADRRLLSLILKRLTFSPLVIQSQVGMHSRLMEPVTAATISAAVQKERKINLPETLVELDEQISEVGEYGIPLRIVTGAGEQAYLRLSVRPLAVKDEEEETGPQ